MSGQLRSLMPPAAFEVDADGHHRFKPMGHYVYPDGKIDLTESVLMASRFRCRATH